MSRWLGALSPAALIALACTHGAPAVATVPREPCAAKGVVAADSSWRQVRADGFTFCVPGSWRPAEPAADTFDARTWRSARGSLTWGVGRPRALIAPDVTFTVSVPVVTVPSSGTPPPAGAPPEPKPTCTPVTNTPYIIGSVSVVVSQVDCGGTRTTTAWSTRPAVYVQAEVHAARDSSLLVAVMETIRIPAPTGP